MKIIKRNGAEATFDISKIIMAITKANAAVEEGDRMTPRQIQRIAESVELACQELGRSAAVEEIQDMVEKQIMATARSRSPRPTSPTATPAAWCAVPTRPTTVS